MVNAPGTPTAPPVRDLHSPALSDTVLVVVPPPPVLLFVIVTSKVALVPVLQISNTSHGGPVTLKLGLIGFTCGDSLQAATSPRIARGQLFHTDRMSDLQVEKR